MENADIIEKVKGLIALANDGKDSEKRDEESQNAFAMARKLMIKYRIEKEDLESTDIGEEVIMSFENFEWWEKFLASLIGKNFRVKAYFSEHAQSKDKILLKYYGLKKDVELAKELFYIAHQTILNYVGHYMVQSKFGPLYRKDYILGFLTALQEKFTKQNENIFQIASRELRLSLQISSKVLTEFEKITKNFSISQIETPVIENKESYLNGYDDAQFFKLPQKVDKEVLLIN